MSDIPLIEVGTCFYLISGIFTFFSLCKICNDKNLKNSLSYKEQKCLTALLILISIFWLPSYFLFLIFFNRKGDVNNK